MPRKPRVQFPGAIYHIVTRGDSRRERFRDDDHYGRLTPGSGRRSPVFRLDRSIGEIMELVAEQHEVDRSQYVGFRSSAPGREMAAIVCRRFTCSTLAELSVAFGLGHPDGAANLVWRAKQLESESPEYRNRLKKIEQAMMKTENQG